MRRKAKNTEDMHLLTIVFGASSGWNARLI